MTRPLLIVLLLALLAVALLGALAQLVRGQRPVLLA